jgi:hypothetical protein
VKEALDPVEKFTHWERFRSLASEFISPSVHIYSSKETDKVTRDFAASIAWAYWLSSRKAKILDLIYKLPGPDLLLKHKKKLRKLWQETWDPKWKTAVNWVTKTIKRTIPKRALEQWEIKLANCKVTSHAIRPIVKSLTHRGGPKAPSVIRDPLGSIFYIIDKGNIIADCLENHSPHKLCDSDHELQVEPTLHALLVTFDEDTPTKFRLSYISNKYNS